MTPFNPSRSFVLCSNIIFFPHVRILSSFSYCPSISSFIGSNCVLFYFDGYIWQEKKGVMGMKVESDKASRKKKKGSLFVASPNSNDSIMIFWAFENVRCVLRYIFYFPYFCLSAHITIVVSLPQTLPNVSNDSTNVFLMNTERYWNCLFGWSKWELPKTAVWRFLW